MNSFTADMPDINEGDVVPGAEDTVLESAPMTPAITYEEAIAELGKFIRNLARHIARDATGSQLDADDLEQIGRMAVLSLIPKYDPAAGSIYGYFSWRIRGAMIDANRDNTFCSRNEAKARQGVGLSNYYAHLGATAWRDHQPRCEDAEVTDSPRAEFLAWLRSLRVEMTRQDLEVLASHYADGLLLRDVGAKVGLSESRVSQIITRAIARIRAEFAAQGRTLNTAFVRSEEL